MCAPEKRKNGNRFGIWPGHLPGSTINNNGWQRQLEKIYFEIDVIDDRNVGIADLKQKSFSGNILIML